MQKFLSLLMLIVLLLVFLLPPAPFAIYYFLHDPFAGGWLFAGVLCAIFTEKLYAMIFRMPRGNLLSVKKDWTAVAVGLTYTGTMYFITAEFFLSQQGIAHFAATIFGLLIYLAALGLRYWSFMHLGRHWAVQLDQAKESEESQLIRGGPYGVIRHPLYTGACLECLAIPLIFNTYWALLFGLAAFVPMEVARARFEENYLRLGFGDEYEKYAAEVPGFIPRPWLGGKSKEKKATNE